MRKSELEAKMGEIVILDLVNGLQFVTTLKSIDIDGYVITTAPWLMFQADLRQQDPNKPPHPQANPISWHVGHGKYGAPVFELADDKPLHPDHIVCLHECPKGLVDVYNKEKTGIVTANEGVLKQLDAANQPRRR